MHYLVRRLGLYGVAAWVAVTVNFVLPRAMPGDAASAMFGRAQGKMSPEALEALREAYGFTDEPLLEQYFTYLSHLLSGDLGVSIARNFEPVTSVLATGLQWTLLVAGTALVISFILGTLLGILVAWRRGGLLDETLPGALIFLGAFPYFWLAMLFVYVLGFKTGLFPVRHAYSAHLTPDWSLIFIADMMAHAFLPVLSIVLASLGGWLLGMRNTMIAVLGTASIKLAWAKGLAPWRVVLHYAARNALLPNLTGFGMALGFVLGGSLLTEIVFSYPGQGYILIEAIRAQDYPLMQGVFLVITLAVLCANWFVDIATYWLDPRTREQGRS
jgi:peptide/nickel transport system permease protein